ncbi:MAG: methyl-accepting chemotaxis protein [Hydrogenoanaerobacterium sp.]
MKSIKTRILISMILTVAISLALIGGVSIYLNYSSTQKLLNQTMQETAKIAAERMSQELQGYINVAYDTGSIARLAKSDTKPADKKSIIDQRSKTHGFEYGNILGTDGKSVFDGVNAAEMDYFKVAMQGKSYVSEPTLNSESKKMEVIVSAPLWEGGIPDTKVVGVVYFVPKFTALSDAVNSIHVSKNGSAYMVNSKGTTIAHKDITRVEKSENVAELAKSNPALSVLAAIHTKMAGGGSGFESYNFGGVNKFIAYAPVGNSNGWSMAINAPTSDFMAGTEKSVIYTLIFMVASLITAAFIASSLANKIGKPMSACTKRLELLATGDLKTPVPDIRTKDETGKLANSTKTIVDALSMVIDDTDYLLDEMASGNFNVRSKMPEIYAKDFAPMLSSMRKINNELSGALSQINLASNQVSNGSDQVSSGSQALSQGATEQASSVEELAATINEISQQIKNNADNALVASQKSGAAGAEVSESNRKMQELVSAMSEISKSSQEIGKVIKTIEDIAFQTNILALNAAVEAARAGAAGKGFAVVADEVRNLASKSAEAAKGTTALIEGSVKAVQNGTRLVDDTAKSLASVMSGTQEVSELVDKISTASNEQANSVAQVTQGIDQISAVVQTNSATAEESAAASEELSGQAAMLKQLVSKFRLKSMAQTDINSKAVKSEPVLAAKVSSSDKY